VQAPPITKLRTEHHPHRTPHPLAHCARTCSGSVAVDELIMAPCRRPGGVKALHRHVRIPQLVAHVVVPRARSALRPSRSCSPPARTHLLRLPGTQVSPYQVLPKSCPCLASMYLDLDLDLDLDLGLDLLRLANKLMAAAERHRP
jgi:hypothetical protein